MIEKLRKKLMALFLISTMLIFSAAMLVITGSTVLRVQDSEIQLANNIADSVLDQIRDGTQIYELELSEYAAKDKDWICVTNGDITKTTPECLNTPSEILLEQMKQESSIQSAMEVEEKNLIGERRTVYSIKGEMGERYYGIHSTTYYAGSTVFDLILIHPQSSIWAILKTDCILYPFIWLMMLLLMHILSSFLIDKALQPVERTMKSQKHFIASASHELKAPLAVIQVNTEAMEFSPKQKIILDECSRMNGLIQSMLSLASSDAGNWKMDIRETNVDMLLIETWEAFSETARKKNIRLNLDIEESYPTIPCDKERVSQVLGIFLDNAISYSPSGTAVQIGAKVQGKKLVFYVIDHGPGIPDSEKEKVFERFYSGDPSRTEKGHYGLGLSIAQEIVRLHYGKIELKDTPSGGCTFEINLPIEKASS